MRVCMDGPEGGSAGKGKGKGRSRDGAGGGASSSTAREEGTPSPNRAAGAGTTYGSLALRLCSSVGAGEMEAPGRKTFFFAVVVSMLALVRNSFLPVSFSPCLLSVVCRLPLVCVGATTNKNVFCSSLHLSHLTQRWYVRTCTMYVRYSSACIHPCVYL